MSPSVGPPDTAGELTELIAPHQLHFGATTTTSEAIVATLMTEKGTATLQIRAAESEQLSAAAMYENPDPHVRSQTRVWVHPDHLGKGIGTALTVWGIANAQSEIPSAPQGARIINICGPRDGGDRAARLLENNGYQLGRVFLEMRIDIGDEMAKPQFPDTVSVRTFRTSDDIVLVADTQHEAFRDHFDWIDRSSEARHAEWSHWLASDVWDDDLVWLVEASDQIVAILTALDSYRSSEDIGYISVLGVLKEWRGRGIAQALLATAFAEFERRNKTAVILHVDAENLTGATMLYEHVGMRVTDQSPSYETEIRPGKDLFAR
jgi:mycothiol synthase